VIGELMDEPKVGKHASEYLAEMTKQGSRQVVGRWANFNM
jgi:hypothetical protein